MNWLVDQCEWFAPKVMNCDFARAKRVCRNLTPFFPVTLLGMSWSIKQIMYASTREWGLTAVREDGGHKFR